MELVVRQQPWRISAGVGCGAWPTLFSELDDDDLDLAALLVAASGTPKNQKTSALERLAAARLVEALWRLERETT